MGDARRCWSGCCCSCCYCCCAGGGGGVCWSRRPTGRLAPLNDDRRAIAAEARCCRVSATHCEGRDLPCACAGQAVEERRPNKEPASGASQSTSWSVACSLAPPWIRCPADRLWLIRLHSQTRGEASTRSRDIGPCGEDLAMQLALAIASRAAGRPALWRWLCASSRLVSESAVTDLALSIGCRRGLCSGAGVASIRPIRQTIDRAAAADSVHRRLASGQAVSECHARCLSGVATCCSVVVPLAGVSGVWSGTRARSQTTSRPGGGSVRTRGFGSVAREVSPDRTSRCSSRTPSPTPAAVELVDQREWVESDSHECSMAVSLHHGGVSIRTEFASHRDGDIHQEGPVPSLATSLTPTSTPPCGLPVPAPPD